jgi:L-seryl-tRNA(Ser) seleniumtransferase
MATTDVDELRVRAAAIVHKVGAPAVVVDTETAIGGGSAPGATLVSAGVGVPGMHADVLRAASTPVLARVVDGATVLDLRTVDATHDAQLVTVLKAAISP